MRTVRDGARCAPGSEILLRLWGWARVQRMLAVIDSVEHTGIDTADIAPAYWQHVNNCLLCGEQSAAL